LFKPPFFIPFGSFGDTLMEYGWLFFKKCSKMGRVWDTD
jgi:hypothetical protein